MCCMRLVANTGRKKSPSGHHHTTLSGYIFGMYRQSEKDLLSSNISSTCPHNMVNFGPVAAEIVSLVRGTPANFSGFHVLAAVLHSTLVVGVSQTLRRWTEGTTYIRQGGHHVGHWPTFLVVLFIVLYAFCLQHSTAISYEWMIFVALLFFMMNLKCLQCFDAVGWVEGRAFGL